MKSQNFPEFSDTHGYTNWEHSHQRIMKTSIYHFLIFHPNGKKNNNKAKYINGKNKNCDMSFNTLTEETHATHIFAPLFFL